MEYTPEQIKDIKEREKEVVDTLKELEFTISAQVLPVNIGDNTFANKVVPYLADTKYAEKTVVEAKEPEQKPEQVTAEPENKE